MTATPATFDVVATARRFDEDGFVILRGLIDADELRSLQAETAAQIAAGFDHEPASDFVTGPGPDGSDRFFRIQFLTDKSIVNDSLLLTLAHPGVLELVAELVGPDWTTYGTAMVFKGEGGGPTIPLHRDIRDLDEIPDPAHVFFNVDIYLDAATPETGVLRVIPGSHRKVDVATDIAVGLDHPDLVDVPMGPGDVLFHHSLLLHCSRPTVPGSQLRRVLYYSYQGAGWMLSEGVLPGLVPPRRWIAESMRLVEHATEQRAARSMDARRSPIAPEWRAEVEAVDLTLRPVAGNLPWEGPPT